MFIKKTFNFLILLLLRGYQSEPEIIALNL